MGVDRWAREHADVFSKFLDPGILFTPPAEFGVGVKLYIKNEIWSSAFILGSSESYR